MVAPTATCSTLLLNKHYIPPQQRPDDPEIVFCSESCFNKWQLERIKPMSMPPLEATAGAPETPVAASKRASNESASSTESSRELRSHKKRGATAALPTQGNKKKLKAMKTITEELDKEDQVVSKKA